MRFRGFFRSAFRQRQRRSFSTTANKLPVSGLLIGSAAFLAAPFFSLQFNVNYGPRSLLMILILRILGLHNGYKNFLTHRHVCI